MKTATLLKISLFMLICLEYLIYMTLKLDPLFMLIIMFQIFVLGVMMIATPSKETWQNTITGFHHSVIVARERYKWFTLTNLTIALIVFVGGIVIKIGGGVVLSKLTPYIGNKNRELAEDVVREYNELRN